MYMLYPNMSPDLDPAGKTAATLGTGDCLLPRVDPHVVPQYGGRTVPDVYFKD